MMGCRPDSLTPIARTDKLNHMPNNETWKNRLDSYTNTKGWTVSWGDFTQGIGKGQYTVIWEVTCTVKGVEYTGKGSSKQKATEASSEAAWKALVENPNDG